jgi:hypothetical protein
MYVIVEMGALRYCTYLLDGLDYLTFYVLLSSFPLGRPVYPTEDRTFEHKYIAHHGRTQIGHICRYTLIDRNEYWKLRCRDGSCPILHCAKGVVKAHVLAVPDLTARH